MLCVCWIKRKDSRQALLDGLLNMETQRVVWDVVVEQSLEGRVVADALRCRSDASSRASGFGKDASLAQRLVQERALDCAPSTGVLLADDDHVGWDQEPSEDPAEACHLTKAILDLGLDNEKVEVAALACLAASVGAEEQHLRMGARRLDQSLRRALDRRLLDYGAHASDCTCRLRRLFGVAGKRAAGRRTPAASPTAVPRRRRHKDLPQATRTPYSLVSPAQEPNPKRGDLGPWTAHGPKFGAYSRTIRLHKPPICSLFRMGTGGFEPPPSRV
jgi:hypothetical protein